MEHLYWSIGKATVRGNEYWACGIGAKYKLRKRATALALVLNAAACDTSIQRPDDATVLQLIESLTKAEVRLVKTPSIDRHAEAAAVEKVVQAVKKCQGDRVGRWRELAKPGKRKVIEMAPVDWPIEISFGQMLQKWLYARGLDKKLRCNSFSMPSEDHTASLLQLGTASPIIYYTYTGSVVQAGEHWEEAYHGSWWYGVWSILESGVLLESNDEEAGHQFWYHGVFCSPPPSGNCMDIRATAAGIRR